MSQRDNPRCFGSSLCYGSVSACQTCALATSCRVQAKARSRNLRVIHNLEFSAQKPPLIDGVKPVTRTVEKTLTLLRERDVNLRQAFDAGVNPFRIKGPVGLRIGFDLLLDGSFTRQTLRAQLMRELGWKEASAVTGVGLIVGVMVAGGIAEERNQVVAPIHNKKLIAA